MLMNMRRMSGHAVQRGRQRNIQNLSIDFVLKHGVWWRQRDGRRAWFLTRKRLKALERNRVAVPRGALNLVVVGYHVGDYIYVITTFKADNLGPIGRKIVQPRGAFRALRKKSRAFAKRRRGDPHHNPGG